MATTQRQQVWQLHQVVQGEETDGSAQAGVSSIDSDEVLAVGGTRTDLESILDFLLLTRRRNNTDRPHS